MAFDRPLEADRVDDLNLFSAFIRVPIVGGLMWLVAGGESTKENEKQQQKIMMERALKDDEVGCENESSDESTSLSLESYSSHQNAVPTVTKALSSLPPKLVSSEVSVLPAGCSSSEFSSNQQLGPNFSEIQESKKENLKKKRMSWSDSLVEYMDESTKHEPPCSWSSSKPVKSVLTRTCSIRGNTGTMQEQEEGNKRYIPNGMDRKHNGIIMPTRPLGTNSSGVESPQWGWYISTTPPTPEMYHNRSSLTMYERKISDLSAETAYTADLSTAETLIEPKVVVARPNLVFQGLQDANKARMEWPSVPL